MMITTLIPVLTHTHPIEFYFSRNLRSNPDSDSIATKSMMVMITTIEILTKLSMLQLIQDWISLNACNQRIRRQQLISQVFISKAGEARASPLTSFFCENISQYDEFQQTIQYSYVGRACR